MHTTSPIGLPALALLAVPLLLAGCSTESAAPDGSASAQGEDLGLVIQNPTDERRPYFHDFGTVPYGRPVSRTFELLNTSAAPVEIFDLMPSCACTTPRISYTAADGTEVRGDSSAETILTLPPGAVAELRLAVDTNRVQAINKDKLATVRLRCSSEVTPYISFEMHVKVERVFQVTPLTMDFGRIGTSVGGSARCDLVRNPPESAGAVLGVRDKSPELEVRVEESEAIGGIPLWIVVADLAPPLELGPWTGFIELDILGIDGEEREDPLRIPVRANVERDLFTEPRGLQFSPRFEGEEGSVTTVLASHFAGQRLKVTRHKVRGPAAEQLEVAVEALSPDSTGGSERWQITLTAKESQPPGAFSGTLTLWLDDEQEEHVDVPYQGVVRKAPVAAQDG